MDVTHEQLVEFLTSIHCRPGGTGAMLNLIRVSEVRGATDVIALSDVVSEPKIKLDLARHGQDEARHAYILLRRMDQIGFRAYRLPPELDRVEGLLAKSRARDVKQVYAERGAVNDAELMELLVAALIPERDAVGKLRANFDALANDHETQALIGSMLRDEQRHVAYLTEWMGWFEKRFSPRAVRAAHARLEETFEQLTSVYYARLQEYFDRAAA
ncbi:MAG TPA: ferritin-like domain-containing protein [Gaiellaceae bacterium]|nr:ferritin-like domain-containing protein [Gaiellaceae bacterium]